MKQGAGYSKSETLPVLMALGFEKALRLRLAHEKRHLRQVKRAALSTRRYKYEL